MCSRRTKAFTLIELLVVIAIIAILVSILMPSLAKAKYTARLAACMSNMHNIGIGVMAYSGEYNGSWPERPSQQVTAEMVSDLPSVEMLSSTGMRVGSAVREVFDDRPLYKGIIPLDLFACPLAQPQSFNYGSLTSEFIYSTYEMYYGHKLDASQPESGLTGNNRRSYTFTYGANTNTFKVMLADWQRMAYDEWMTSHPDREPTTLAFYEAKDADYGYKHSWTSWAGDNIGGQAINLDRNFLYTDCSIKTMRNMKTLYYYRNYGELVGKTVTLPAVSQTSDRYVFLPPN